MQYEIACVTTTDTSLNILINAYLRLNGMIDFGVLFALAGSFHHIYQQAAAF